MFLILFMRVLLPLLLGPAITRMRLFFDGIHYSSRSIFPIEFFSRYVVRGRNNGLFTVNRFNDHLRFICIDLRHMECRCFGGCTFTCGGSDRTDYSNGLSTIFNCAKILTFDSTAFSLAVRYPFVSCLNATRGCSTCCFFPVSFSNLMLLQLHIAKLLKIPD